MIDIQGAGTTTQSQATTKPPRLTSERVLEYSMLGVLLALTVAATAIYPRFLELGNLSIVLSQYAPLGVVAVGMTLVIIAGGFDLSVGAIFAAGATTAAALAPQYGVPVAFLLALVGGVVLGFVNALGVTLLRVNPFITTLGTSSLYAGAVLLLSNSTAFSVTNPEFQLLGTGSVLGIPNTIIVLIVVFAAGSVVLNFTSFGRGIYAVGGSREAARLSGIRVDFVTGSTYVIAGFLAALAGVMTASQQGAGQGSMGATVALDAIAIVVIGGTSLVGGEGKLWRTAVGMLILAVLDNIFYSLAVDSNAQLIFKGTIIIAAVAADQLVRRGRR
ncbi:ABC transporter permease [Microbacterium sp. NPDC058389]|uniref:ABC transporter permease n=1 Tax=Microbacterium sp. NPDC058389 TaxID=3346475 RepID=UPI0036576602